MHAAPRGPRGSGQPVRIEVEEDGALGPVMLIDLEEDVRRGRIPLNTRVRHPSWGPHLLAIREVPELREASDAPAARMADRLRHPPLPWMTLVIAVGVLLAAGLQVATMMAGTADLWLIDHVGTDEGTALRVARRVGWLQGLGDAWMSLGVLDANGAWLDGRWYTPWTWAATHAGLGHALVNVILLMYCGFRVERALGPGALTAVIVGSWWAGSLAVLLGSDLPVAGSSVLTYGAWGAMMAIGIRYDDALPAGHRTPYHLLNLVLFVPLWLMSLPNEGVSHLAHAGGLAGGVLAVLMVPADATAPASQARGRTLANLAGSAIGLAALPLLALIGMFQPGLAYAPSTPHAVEQAGITLHLPRGFAPLTGHVRGYPAWWSQRTDDHPLAVGLVERDGPPEPLSDADRTAWWARSWQDPQPLPPPHPAFAGGEAHAWLVQDDELRWTRLEQHTLVRGLWSLRAFWSSAAHADGSPKGGRTTLYRQVLADAEIGDIPELVTARARHQHAPDQPDAVYDLATAELRSGQPERAEALLAEIAAGPDASDRLTALRFTTWHWYPATAPSDAVDWASERLAMAKWWQRGLIEPGARWLASIGECDAVQRIAEGAREGAEVTEPVQEAWLQELEGLPAICRFGG